MLYLYVCKLHVDVYDIHVCRLILIFLILWRKNQYLEIIFHVGMVFNSHTSILHHHQTRYSWKNMNNYDFPGSKCLQNVVDEFNSLFRIFTIFHDILFIDYSKKNSLWFANECTIFPICIFKTIAKKIMKE